MFMGHSHCTGLGTATEPGVGPELMGLYIMPLTVHTAQGQGQGMGLETYGLHTHFPIPIHYLCPVQCEWAISLSKRKGQERF